MDYGLLSKLFFALMRFVQSLLWNPHIHVEPYLHQLMPPVITCTLAKRLGKRIADNHWEVRDFAANHVAHMCKRFGHDYTSLQMNLTTMLFKPFLDRKWSLTQLYGTVQGPTALGPVVLLCILPNLKTNLGILEEIFCDNEQKEMTRYEAWHVYGALLATVKVLPPQIVCLYIWLCDIGGNEPITGNDIGGNEPTVSNHTPVGQENVRDDIKTSMLHGSCFTACLIFEMPTHMSLYDSNQQPMIGNDSRMVRAKYSQSCSTPSLNLATTPENLNIQQRMENTRHKWNPETCRPLTSAMPLPMSSETVPARPLGASGSTPPNAGTDRFTMVELCPYNMYSYTHSKLSNEHKMDCCTKMVGPRIHVLCQRGQKVLRTRREERALLFEGGSRAGLQHQLYMQGHQQSTATLELCLIQLTQAIIYKRILKVRGLEAKGTRHNPSPSMHKNGGKVVQQEDRAPLYNGLAPLLVGAACSQVKFTQECAAGKHFPLSTWNGCIHLLKMRAFKIVNLIMCEHSAFMAEGKVPANPVACCCCINHIAVEICFKMPTHMSSYDSNQQPMIGNDSRKICIKAAWQAHQGHLYHFLGNKTTSSLESVQAVILPPSHLKLELSSVADAFLIPGTIFMSLLSGVLFGVGKGTSKFCFQQPLRYTYSTYAQVTISNQFLTNGSINYSCYNGYKNSFEITCEMHQVHHLFFTKKKEAKNM
ncbi:TATA BOX ASSOCIATED FACTOR II 59 [Artemisia annua]|uniref:TATA BOX ASSOCIATED FACTOR II 59 n=1 Tax=Artemisia annua TaxID=35608 RepID=A0A2U1LB16_ARTAN|nr:TATA BOX ASSOCIATED FACTOR II 59 [Artemisia annua]